MYDNVIGYAFQGAIHCPDCIDEQGYKDSLEPPTAILKGQNNGDIRPGEACGTCGNWFTPDEDWQSHEDYPPEGARWAKCKGVWEWRLTWRNYCEVFIPGCGTMEAFYHKKHYGRQDVRTRYDARIGQLSCPNCLKPMNF